MKIHFLITTLMLFASLQPLVAAAKTSPEIQRVLDERYDGKYDLNLDGLTQSELSADRSNKLQNKSYIEVYRIPYPKGTEDYFRYSIFRFQTGEVWILKSGGFAGVSELYIISLPHKAEQGAAANP